MRGRVISAICNKHGYHQGSACMRCIDEECNTSVDVFNTTRDRLYNFHSTSLGIDIDGKSHWKRELKSRGLSDDFNQGKIEIKTDQPRPKINREEIKSNIRNEMKQRGIYDPNKLFLKEAKRYRV